MDGYQPPLLQGNNPAAPPARPQRARKPGQRAAQVVLALLLCVGLFFSLFPLGRAITRGALLLPSLLSVSPPAPLVLAGSGVQFTRLTLFPNTPHAVYLDIYEPSTPPSPVPGGREAIIIIPGAGDNRGVPQLINLSQSFAREGVVVADVGTPALFDYRVLAQDGEAVVQAFELMERWPGVDPRRIGIVSFSVGDELACVGAADPRIRDSVAFLGTLGGYADVTTLLSTLGRRAQEINGKMQPWYPIEIDLYTLARTPMDLLTPTDNQLLLDTFPLTANSAPPLSAQQQALLSPDALAYYHLLEGDEPGSVNRNLSVLSPTLKALLTQLSPLSVLDQIRAPIYLLHDRDDPSIPFSQALEFAAALERLHHPYTLAAYSIFSHVLVSSNIDLQQELGDGSKLLQTLINILLVGS